MSIELTKEEERLFDEQGWFVRKSVFSLDEVAMTILEFNELEALAQGLRETTLLQNAQFVMNPGPEGEPVLARVVWAGGARASLLQFGADARLLTPVMDLLRTEVVVQLLNQAHFKRPGDGVAFDWHQDIQHRDKGGGSWRDVGPRGSYVQTISVLDAMDLESGPLEFIPSSNQWGPVRFKGREMGPVDLLHQTAIDPRDHEVVRVIGEPGDVIFFGPYTAHMSRANTSDHYRRVLINGYAVEGANFRHYPGVGLGRVMRL